LATNLTKAIQRPLKLANMLGRRKRKARWGGHVYLFMEITMKKGIIDIKLF